MRILFNKINLSIICGVLFKTKQPLIKERDKFKWIENILKLKAWEVFEFVWPLTAGPE